MCVVSDVFVWLWMCVCACVMCLFWVAYSLLLFHVDLVVGCCVLFVFIVLDKFFFFGWM